MSDQHPPDRPTPPPEPGGPERHPPGDHVHLPDPGAHPRRDARELLRFPEPRRPRPLPPLGPRRRSLFPTLVLLVLAFFGGALVQRGGYLFARKDRQPPGLDRTFTPFWEAWHEVKENFVDREKVDDERMTQGAIRGMINSLGDVGHSAYLTREERERLRESLASELQGIGVRMSMPRRQPTIIQVLPNSPARKAGVKAGDVLVEINGQDVSGLSFRQIGERIRGPAGTVVKIRAFRPEESRTVDFSITRAKVEIPEVSWHLLPGAPVAHLAIQGFSKKTDEQLRAALDRLRAKGAKGLILDLRGNPGGLKEQAVAVTSEFVPEGKVVFIQQDAKGKQQKVLAKGGGKGTDIPLVVLIDAGTASSAEILAGAIQDHKRGKLVGTRTFGTGTVLRQYDLSDGGAILLAQYQWLTPTGRRIWHQGISPDPGLEVTMPLDTPYLFPDDEGKLTAAALAKSADKQLLKALEVIKKEIR
jgi:carboxyl-terminal processing protease